MWWSLFSKSTFYNTSPVVHYWANDKISGRIPP
ncbi:unnamed protein product [Ectocarpus sp. CCAP 1310/34]|nr:unnamed protein product [Ectocarpus sp. CCAP 1310/34]